MLPDDVLLDIFDFYANEYMDEDSEQSFKQRKEGWITLTHVCRRWRNVIFQSPRRLDLQLFCTSETPVRDTLDIWPPLPLLIRGVFDEPSSVDNVIAALERNDRVRQINLEHLTSSQSESVTSSAAMRKPFLELTHLGLGLLEPGPILPDSFLGGTAPRLRELRLCGVPFPGFPKLLLSATQLVHLDLFSIPPSGYIPLEAMATTLSALTSLESLYLRFRYPRPRPAIESRRPPPLTRYILPSLTFIIFNGPSENLEEILARIDAPRINIMYITYFNQIIFNTPQLFQFISQVERPTRLRAPKEGRIIFDSSDITVRFPLQTSDSGVLSVKVPCTASERQLSSLAQVCTSGSSLPPLSTLEDLYILEPRAYAPRWQDDFKHTLWLDLLRPFVAVRNLLIRGIRAPCCALPARTRRWKNDRSFAHPGEYFLRRI